MAKNAQPTLQATVNLQSEDPRAWNDYSVGRYLRSIHYLCGLLADDRVEFLETALLRTILHTLGKAFQMR